MPAVYKPRKRVDREVLQTTANSSQSDDVQQPRDKSIKVLVVSLLVLIAVLIYLIAQ